MTIVVDWDVKPQIKQNKLMSCRQWCKILLPHRTGINMVCFCPRWSCPEWEGLCSVPSYTGYLKLSRNTTKPTKWPVRPAKTQVSLGICPVWSVFAVRSVGSLGPKVPSSRHWRLWSDLADAQADLSMLGAQVILLVLSCYGLNKVSCHSQRGNDVLTVYLYRWKFKWNIDMV